MWRCTVNIVMHVLQIMVRELDTRVKCSSTMLKLQHLKGFELMWQPFPRDCSGKLVPSSGHRLLNEMARNVSSGKSERSYSGWSTSMELDKLLQLHCSNTSLLLWDEESNFHFKLYGFRESVCIQKTPATSSILTWMGWLSIITEDWKNTYRRQSHPAKRIVILPLFLLASNLLPAVGM